MAIKVDIIKTSRGYNYRNSESRRLVGAINESVNKPGVFGFDTFGAFGFDTEEGCHKRLQEALRKHADQLGEEIEFINI